MAKKKTSTPSKTPRSFAGVVRGRSKPVKQIAEALRALVFEEVSGATETYYGGQRPMAMYRTNADICWIQPLKERCNFYLMRGTELTDDDGLLEGTSDRFRFVRVPSLEDVETLPLRGWLAESLALNEAAASAGLSYDEVHGRLRKICLALPKTKETVTWGKPHFRVNEKIFCGCGEEHGRARLGLKLEKKQSEQMMRLPGIEKAPYSRPGDGWVSIDPNVFDDWDEIEECVRTSFCLVAPKKVAAMLEDS